MKLYKFMTYRQKFFEEYSLRFTSYKSLNDPFECLPAISDLKEVGAKIGLGDLGQIDSFLDSYHPDPNSIGPRTSSEYYRKLMGAHDEGLWGILSLSLTKKDILLWSHYADEHRGIAIEFNGEHDFFSNTDDTISSRVDYSKSRKLEDNRLFDAINVGKFFKKYSSWRYEKEYRVLKRLPKADRICFLNKKHLVKAFQALKYDPVLRKFVSNHLIPLWKKQNPTRVDKGEGYRIEDLTQLCPKRLQDLSARVPSTLFLFDVPFEAITAVYLGFRISDKDKSEIECLLKNTHVKIYKSTMDEEHFKLNFQQLIT
ncbi:DUF2971 domain-containing protein [Vibrio fluvialis]|nr:DUF2971 domain-containing protein [Vibrio fluvialis]MBY8190928.1 DUF2971 domain-containing protein [Vibrio fluvialis]